MSIPAVKDFVSRYSGCFKGCVTCPPLYIDLQGGKFRISGEQAVTSVNLNDELFVGIEAAPTGATALIDDFTLRQLRRMEPEVIGLHDGKVLASVNATTDTGFRCTVTRANGKLMPRKGVNVPGRNIDLHELSSKDAAIVRATSPEPHVRYALSFISTVDEVRDLRTHSVRGDVFVAGKVEHAFDMGTLKALEGCVDEWWVCRGDLGVQLGHFKMAEFVRWFTANAVKSKRSIIAGEVLQCSVHTGLPSRAEMCHLMDCLAAGYAGFVLSDETAYGRYATEVAAWGDRFLEDWGQHGQAM